MKVRITTSFFQKIQNPTKLLIRHQLSWKWLQLMGCDCFTGVPNFISISQAVYELSGFETLTIGHTRTHTQTHTHIHTYIRTPAKNHISRRFRLPYSEYCDTNISKFFYFHKTTQKLPQWGSKNGVVSAWCGLSSSLRIFLVSAYARESLSEIFWRSNVIFFR